jgi:ABC-type spermidine/putrescine transport system permease subunit II
MIPLGFPVLVVPGAVVLDLVLDRFAARSDNWKAAVAGIGFLAATVAVNWPFAYFMMSSYARNWIFAMNEFGYDMPPSQYHLAWTLRSYEKTHAEFWVGMLIALIATVVSARIGMFWGDWMRRIRR